MCWVDLFLVGAKGKLRLTSGGGKIINNVWSVFSRNERKIEILEA